MRTLLPAARLRSRKVLMFWSHLLRIYTEESVMRTEDAAIIESFVEYLLTPYKTKILFVKGAVQKEYREKEISTDILGRYILLPFGCLCAGSD